MNRKILKVFGILITVLLILLVVLGLALRIYGPKYLVPYVVKEVREATNGRYMLSVNADSVNVHLISLSLNLGFTEFKRDTTVDEYCGIPMLDKFDVTANFNTFSIQSLELWKFLLDKRIVVNTVSLDQPSIRFVKNLDYNRIKSEAAKSDSIPPQSLSARDEEMLADTLTIEEFRDSKKKINAYVRVKDFKVNDAHFALYDGRKRYAIQEVYGLDVELDDFRLKRDGSRKVADAFIHIDSASTLVSKNIARISLKGIDLQQDTIKIDQFHYGHIVDRYAINRIKGFRASWLDANITDIDIHGIHTDDLIGDSVVNIDMASIGNVDLYLFKDKEELIINPDYKPLPTEQIRKIPLPLLFDTLQIANGDIIVDMEASQAIAPGRITLNNVGVDILNLTNIKELLEQKPEMKMHATFDIMDSAAIDFNASFNVNSLEDEFHVSCAVSPFNASILNDFVGSQFFIEFADGDIHSLNFQFDGNNKANVGTMDFEYQNLKVRKLKDYQKFIEGKPKTGFIAGVGNILIPSKRSMDSKGYKTAVIYYEKEYNRDFVHGTIQALLTGVESSLGILSKNLDKRQSQAEQLSEEDVAKSAEKAKEEVEKANKRKAKDRKN